MNKEKLTVKLASMFHENWRSTRLNSAGDYEPHWKEIKDKKFIEKLAGSIKLPVNVKVKDNIFYIDIANSPFEQLSADWQEENYNAAKVVVDILCYEEKKGKLEINSVGNIIHNAWLSRNEWAKGGELDVPFEQLSKEEQDKYLQQYYTGRKMLNKQQENGITL